MSFILDALKKAESERGRATGPVLVDVRIAPPRRRLPAWAWVLGAVLLANLAVLAWLMLRVPLTPDVAATESPQAKSAATTGAAPVPAGLPAASPPTATLPPSPLPPPTLPATTAATSPSLPSTRPATTPPADLSTLPTLRELQATGIALPPLLLNLHVYDPSPSLRYVMMNGLRLAEGDFTPDGIKVEAIVERGVVLEARGQRFLLPTGG